MQWLSTSALAVICALPVTGVEAQTPNFRTRPLYGSATVASGFSARPRSVELVAGGSARNPIGGEGCVGYIATPQPDYRVTYTPGPRYDLSFSTRSDSDTALLVRTPDGTWLCNDDADGENARLLVSPPSAGAYNIWVATYERASARATLVISEVVRSTDVLIDGMNVTAAPRYGTVSLTPSDASPVRSIAVTAGGPVQNPVPDSECSGYLAPDRMDVKLDYMAGSSGALEIRGESASDTVLLVRRPDGSWICNDDDDGINPVVRIDRPRSGTYAIWLGTYGGDTAGATLRILDVRE